MPGTGECWCEDGAWGQGACALDRVTDASRFVRYDFDSHRGFVDHLAFVGYSAVADVLPLHDTWAARS